MKRRNRIIVVFHHVKRKLHAAKLRHEVAAALLIVLTDGLVRALYEADYLTSAVKGGFIATVIALGIDLD